MSYINGIDFSILSPELIKSMARVRIVSSELYDADGYPVEGGVMDPRLGVIDPGLHCRTCNGGIGECKNRRSGGTACDTDSSGLQVTYRLAAWHRFWCNLGSPAQNSPHARETPLRQLSRHHGRCPW